MNRLFQRDRCNAIILGLPIVFLSLAMMTGSLINAASLLAFSIICTLGIGLVFWLLIAWIVGWIILSGVVPLFKQMFPSVGQGNSANEEDRWEGGEAALKGYIQRSVAANATESQITNRLISQGWSETEIEQAYQAVRGQQ